MSGGTAAMRLANLRPCLIGIDAGMATHYVGFSFLLEAVTDLVSPSA
jgi:hypothetical protein